MEELLEQEDLAIAEPQGVSQEAEGPVCPLEPDQAWEDSICGELEEKLNERIAARLLAAVETHQLRRIENHQEVG